MEESHGEATHEREWCQIDYIQNEVATCWPLLQNLQIMPDRRARRPVRDSARAGFHPYAKPKEAKEDLRALVRLCVPVQESESALENSHEKDHQLQEAQRPQKMGGRLPIQERAAAENWAELFDPRP